MPAIQQVPAQPGQGGQQVQVVHQSPSILQKSECKVAKCEVAMTKRPADIVCYVLFYSLQWEWEQ